jgi:membrane dipeptidase
MPVADLHCDVLGKMLLDETLPFDDVSNHGAAAGGLDVTVGRLRAGGVGLQVFAIYVDHGLPMTPETALRAAALFWDRVLAAPGMALVRTAADLDAVASEGKTAAILSLEGVDSLRGQWWALRLLHRLGLRLLGLTWNDANWAADGVMEPRGGGLTAAGKQLVKECESLGILLDVSHLSERGFWDLAETATRPFFASHANARRIHNHPRNLTDEQIRAIIAVGGVIGLTFVPDFLAGGETAGIDDVLRHVEHVCALGGEHHLAFGSDFDGIDRHVTGLEHPGRYPDLVEALLKRYPERLVRRFLAENARRFLRDGLPS